MRAYQEEPDKTTAQTHVIEKRNIKGKTAVRVARNIFYPGGGGQPQDKGVLVAPGGKKHAIERSLVLDKQQFLVIEAPFNAPDAENIKEDAVITIEIDGLLRRKYTRMHTAAHLLMGAVKALMDGYEPEGIEIAQGGETGTISFIGEFKDGNSPQDAIDLANRMVKEDRKVWISQHESLDHAREATKDIFRFKGALNGSVSLAVIDGFDANPCGGTHVQTLNEIGGIELKEAADSSMTFSLQGS